MPSERILRILETWYRCIYSTEQSGSGLRRSKLCLLDEVWKAKKKNSLLNFCWLIRLKKKKNALANDVLIAFEKKKVPSSEDHWSSPGRRASESGSASFNQLVLFPGGLEHFSSNQGGRALWGVGTCRSSPSLERLRVDISWTLVNNHKEAFRMSFYNSRHWLKVQLKSTSSALPAYLGPTESARPEESLENARFTAGRS